MSLANAAENLVLSAILRGGSAPTPTHIALLTADPGEAGSLASEVSGGSYARYAIGVGATFWAAPSGGTTSNAATFEFIQATAAWGTVTHFALCDALTAGTVIMSDALTVSKVVGDGDILRFVAGALTVSAD